MILMTAIRSAACMHCIHYDQLNLLINCKTSQNSDEISVQSAQSSANTVICCSYTVVLYTECCAVEFIDLRRLCSVVVFRYFMCIGYCVLLIKIIQRAVVGPRSTQRSSVDVLRMTTSH